jgi:hypothetical protein
MERYDDEYFDSGYDDEIFVEPPLDGDAVEHLWNAAHELLRAVRTLVDAADEFVETQRQATSRRVPRRPAPEEARVRRIDIDGRTDGADEPAPAPGDHSSGTPGATGAAPR